jgi:hypothetical protein
MVVPHRQHCADINQDRTAIGAPQSGHAHINGCPLNNTVPRDLRLRRHFGMGVWFGNGGRELSESSETQTGHIPLPIDPPLDFDIRSLNQ